MRMFAPSWLSWRDTSSSEKTVMCRMATRAVTPRRMASTLDAIAVGRSQSSFQTRVRRFMNVPLVVVVFAIRIVAAVTRLVHGGGDLLLGGGGIKLADQNAGRRHQH